MLAAIAYSVFSLVRYAHLGAGGFDLGIFDQTVWHYSRFEAPGNSVRGLENIWGDHFSPILVLLAPLYWIWEDARMLLLAQAVLLAAAAIPIFLYVKGRLGRLPAYLLALAYLTFWGVQSALSFDFHELAFAPLLIALILLAVERRQWRAYFPLVIALLCVKEDLSILVVFLGIYVLSLGARREGLITIALGVAWYVLVVKLLIPAFNPKDDYAYWSYEQFGDGPLSALGHALTHPGQVVRTLFDSDVKTRTLGFLVVPFLGLMLCSRTVILLLPLVAERFLSTTEAYWNTGGQYTLPMTAILVIGAADGLSNLLGLTPARSRRRLATGAAGVVLVLNLGYAASFPLSFTDLFRSGFYEAPAFVEDAERALAAVPPDVSVAAQDNLIPRLAHRDLAAEISADTGKTDYVVANLFDLGAGLAPNGGFPAVSKFVDSRLATHVPVAYVNGWLVLRAKALTPVPRAPQLVPLRPADAAQVEALQTSWVAALGQYGQEFATCFPMPDPRACLQRAGGPFRRAQARLAAELERLRPSLETGCLQLSSVADITAQAVADALEATRKAGIEGATAELARRTAALRELQAKDAPRYVTRFAALCSPP